MGTRSLTIIKSDDGKTDLATIYRQYDGYPTGLGKDLKDFLGQAVLVNGYGSDDPTPRFNGMGCLAASLIGQLKGGRIGNVYLYPNGSNDCGEEFVYTISPGEEKESGRKTIRSLVLNVKDGEKTIYDGPIADFDPEKCEEQANA